MRSVWRCAAFCSFLLRSKGLRPALSRFSLIRQKIALRASPLLSLSGAELPHLSQALSPGRWNEARVPVVASWWVFIPPLRDEQELVRKVRELRNLGIEDYYVLEGSGEMRSAISLGIFKSEDTAVAFLEGLRTRGVRSARVGNRDHRITQTVFVVREPDVSVSSRLAELALRFPGTELKSGACPQ